MIQRLRLRQLLPVPQLLKLYWREGDRIADFETNTGREPMRLFSTRSTGLRNRDLYGVVAGGAGGMWRSFFVRLGLSLTVGGAYFEGVITGLRLPVVDVLTPGIGGELRGERRVVPGLAAIGRDLDALDTTVRSPGDAADRYGTCG